MRKILLTVFVTFTLLVSGCGGGQIVAETTPTPFPTPVRPTFTVARGDITVEAKLSGRVSALALYTVYFDIPGQVSEVFVNVGDLVNEGQLLGELDVARELRANANQTKRIIRRAQIDLEIAKLTLEQYESQERPLTDIEIQKLQVELAQINFDELMESMGIDPNAVLADELDAQVAQARAFAPADGTIISSIEVGRKVAPITSAFILGDPGKLEIIADLAAGDDEVREMFEGMPVTVAVDARSGLELTGTIRQLPSPYGTGPGDERVIHVVLDDRPSEDTYQLGDKVTVYVTLANKQDILWLPPDAIHSAGGRTFVIVNSDNGPQRVDVELGLQTRDMVEIIAGLVEGQVVVGP
ncbi:MAG TPA: biotin/lipoyl-binding protein [Anaerolineales bacterium]|nr:biotin/lipoyl-binding protein [Anaerolineales bacterium]